jgi:hypothetical protein
VAKAKLRRRLAGAEDELTTRPDAALVDVLRIPEKFVSPTQRILRRVLYAALALFAAVLIVYLDRDGYRDVQNDRLSILDCVYYATVAVDDGIRRHHAVHAGRAAGQRPGDHPTADRVPDRVDRHHGRDADDAVTSGPQDPAMEEQSA